MKQEYEKKGYMMVKNVFDDGAITSLIDALSVLEKDTNQYGVRDLMNKFPCIAKLALSTPLLSIAKDILGSRAKPIRAVFFDKLPGANWNVAWHQDTSIVVKAKVDMPGFQLWREKQGAIYVEPPEEYLSNIVTLRIHLDPSNSETGVLRVIPKSHKDGRVKSKDILSIVEQSEVMACIADAGDVLVMSPLLFHSSRKAVKPEHRRIIHLEYSAMLLPKPLEWSEGV